MIAPSSVGTFRSDPYTCNTSVTTELNLAATPFQRYKPRRLKIRCIPLDPLRVGWACLSYSPNPQATTPASMTTAISMTHSHAGSMSKELKLDVHVKSNVNWLNCRVSGSIDNLLESFGIYFISTEGCTSNTVGYIVEIIVEVEFAEFTNTTVAPKLMQAILEANWSLAATMLLDLKEKSLVTTNPDNNNQQVVVRK